MIRLIPATPSDLDFVYSCINALEETVFEKHTFDKLYAEALDAQHCFLFVISHHNQKVGYMSLYIQNLLHHCGKVAEVQELIVLPGSRSGGVGKAAITFAKTFAKQKGCMLIELASNMKREDAQRFYMNNGFKRSHYKFTCEL